MKVDSLDELKSVFSEWRRRKVHVREPVPEALLARARRATQKHGVTAVVGVTRVERTRLFQSRVSRVKMQGARRLKPQQEAPSVPAFSRLELGAPSAPGIRPIAEVETGAGVKLRVFEPTPETMGLLSALCGLGGVR
jgi:hypothetical protein